MIPVARMGDMVFGICFAHDPPIPVTGRIVTASGDVTTNFRPTGRMGDIVFLSCGHTSLIATGSGSVTVNFRPIARLGDIVSTPNFFGHIVTASGDVTAGA